MTADVNPPEVWQSGAPVLGVRDVDAAASFLRDRLGFTITDLHGKPPVFAIAFRGGCKVMLRPCRFLETRIASDWSLYIPVADAGSVRADLLARGAPVGDLSDKQHGVREFEVQGPERHVLVFGQTLSG